MTTKHGPGVPYGTSFTSDGGGGGDELWFRNRRIHPLVATPFQSAFAGQTLTCPDCARPLAPLGERFGCTQCGGMFVEIAALEAMFAEMTHVPWHAPAPNGSAGKRGCPVCQVAMTIETLEIETVDRCAAHGMWFDEGELGGALAKSASQTEGLGSRLRKALFGGGK